MSKRGNGVEKPDDDQIALDLGQEAPAPAVEQADTAPAAEQEAAAPAVEQEAAASAIEQVASEGEVSEIAEAPANPVSELGNTQEGCWKVLADGERVDISDQEWRKELTRLLATSLTTP